MRTIFLAIIISMMGSAFGWAQESCKYLVHKVSRVAEEQAPFVGDPQAWLPSSEWQAKINADTHEVSDPPGGVVRSGDFVDEFGNPRWKIVDGAWVQRDASSLDADRVTKADVARRVKMAYIGAAIDHCTAQGSAFDAAKAELQAAYDAMSATLGTAPP